MFVIASVLGSSIIIIFFIREGSSETYRCPYCGQLQLGTSHRLKCFILSGQENNLLVARKTRSHEDYQVTSRNRLANRESEMSRAPIDRTRRILAFLPGLFGHRTAEKAGSAE